MFNKKKKHPFTIRTPENINKEYTEVMFKFGSLDVESLNLEESQSKLINRLSEIVDEKEALFDEVKRLSLEMDESQKHIRDKAQKEEAKKTESEQVQS